MAADITVHGLVDDDGPATRAATAEALGAFTLVHDTCSRFDPDSALSRVNARPDRWHHVPSALFSAVVAAHDAYRRTGGRFDPRVLGDLVRLGYDANLSFASPHGPARARARSGARGQLPPWQPEFQAGSSPRLHPGGLPIDLGGIGKGLALRWATERLRGDVGSFLIDAGGDCAAVGRGPEGGGWRVGVEHPLGGDRPVAVLGLSDTACATSSVRVRRWRTGSTEVHHLIDPRTGGSGGPGLAAVTVVGADPAAAEVTSKALFLEGVHRIATAAARQGVAALWVAADGTVGESPELADVVKWRATP
jgi:thiamine biosynthesis lipoprotein